MPWDQRSRRRAELPADWAVIRRDVLARDHYTCQLGLAGCTTRATECDHVGNRHNHSRANLRAACTACHGKRTAEQGQDAMRLQRAKLQHPVERHPGLA